MTAFHPISPLRALELVEAAGIAHAARLIRDHAAAEMVKSYARVRETWDPRGNKHAVRDAAIPADLWQRMIRQGVDEEVWAGGTVRLPGDDMIGGAPTVHVTGVGFKADDLHRMINDHLGTPREADQPVAIAAKDEPFTNGAAPLLKPKRQPDPALLSPGKLLFTIGEAGAALGYGRTKVNDLLKAGKLRRAENADGVRITGASVRALAGIAD